MVAVVVDVSVIQKNKTITKIKSPLSKVKGGFIILKNSYIDV